MNNLAYFFHLNRIIIYLILLLNRIKDKNESLLFYIIIFIEIIIIIVNTYFSNQIFYRSVNNHRFYASYNSTKIFHYSTLIQNDNNNIRQYIIHIITN